MKEMIARITHSYREKLLNFLREIIAIPSISGNEAAVIERIRQEMQYLGYDNIRVDPFGNLLATVGSGSKIIAFDGHCDTVDVGNPANWSVPPFAGESRDHVIYGRGAADQKAGLATAIYAGKLLKEIGIPAGISVLVCASVLEEDFEGLCWRYIIEEDNITPAAVILTEPTNLGIAIGQRGRMEMKVETKGISCHGSAPQRGVNAIYQMAPIIPEIEKLNLSLAPRGMLGKGTITVTDIRSSAPSLCAVADSAIIHLDRRLTEGETMETAIAEIAALEPVKSVEAQVTVPGYDVTSYTGLVYPITAYYPMWLMETQHPLVDMACRAFSKQFGKEGETGVWQFSTNGVSTKGGFNIPTIGFGPGEEQNAHTPYDQVKEADIVTAVQFYTAAALEFAR